MSSKLYLLGRWSVKAKRFVVLIWVAVLALLLFVGISFTRGFDDSVTIPGTESGDALERLAATFPEVSGASAQIVITSEGDSRIDEGDNAAAINAAVESMQAHPEVEQVSALNDQYAPAEISDDGSTALISVQLSGDQTAVTEQTKDDLRNIVVDLNADLPADSEATLGGSLFAAQFPGVSLTEALGVLVAMIVLVITLGTLIAAGLPLLTALFGVGVSMALVLVATTFATVNATTPLLAVMLGLAVGIDYSLFIVSRHQDQLKRGMTVTESIGRSLGTAGSAVVFAGATVMIALAGLGVAGLPFLTVMGIAGAMAVGVAVLAALTLLPALLAFAGMRVLTKKQRAAITGESGALASEDIEAPKQNRFFLFWVNAATRWPAVTAILVIGVLGVLSLPTLGLRLALPDAGVLPRDNDARITYDTIADNFGEGFNGPLIVTTPIVTSTDPLGLMDNLAREMEQIDGVAAVALATPNRTADTGIVQVIPEGAPASAETEQVVYDIRAQHDYLQEKYGVDIAVTGYTAVGIDVSAKLMGALLPFGLLVVGLSLVLLTIVFRSIAVPITAAAGYLLSLGAAFGLVTVVFEWGWAAEIFGVTRLGPVINFMPIVVMGVLFGLSMDYEVFLVARMREDYVHSGDARKSVITGFMGSAKVVAAAAVIMVAVFAAFVPEGDMSLKPIALALALGVGIDAFIVRMTLIPALMMWLGDRAWWIPKWLDRSLPVFDIEGAGILRQRSLKDWPGVDTTIAASDLVVGSNSHPVSFMLMPGTSLLVSGPQARVSPMLRAIAGREEPSSGILKTLDLLVPERSGAVRRKVAYLHAGGEDNLKQSVRRATDEGAKLIVIDMGNDLSELADLKSDATLVVGAVPGCKGTLPGGASRVWQRVELTEMQTKTLQEVQ